ncbi:MAG: hypothetical protein RIR48_2464 [Bacteroidota bacterium]|jgi:starch-binding outer membrane protein, SusD/RagB family
MKKLKLYIIVLLSIIFFNACSDLLNVEPTTSISNQVAVSSEENVKKLLIGIYEIDGNNNGHGGYIQIFSDLLGSDDQVAWNGTFAQPREALTKTMDSNNFIIDAMWKNLYRTINQCNIVLDNITIIKDKAEREKAEGEARFLRAFSYFELIRLFGTNTKGVPLRLTSVKDFGSDLSIKRNSTDEVYAAIQDDINKSIALLPETNGFYADKFAATALSARVNLYLGKYAEARTAAHNVILNSKRSLASSYAEAFNNDENGSEDIFAMQVTSQSGFNQLISMYASQENGGRGGDISLTNAFFNIFDDPNDERALFNYKNKKGQILTSKYTSQFGNVPVIRLAEMVLIRAESNRRLNTSIGNDPLKDINNIRQRSGASILTSVTVESILTERKRELAFEGFAIYDIKRTGSSIKGLPSASPKLVMPIPRAELDANNLMEQNEGY